MRFTTPHKRLQVAVCGLLFAFSPALHALGLGDAHVRSFLGQPLDVRIDLISHSQEELDAVTAGLANAADFRIVGLDRAALSVPLQFQVHADLADPHLRATSSLPVNDPVVQFVVAVSFPGGRMLREYMLFLDPPTFPAAVPMPALSPREAAVRPRPERPAATVAIEPETQPRVEPVPAEAPSASAPVPTAPARPEAGAGDVATAPGEPFQEPAVPEPQPAQPPRLIYREPAGGATYGPVARGETLWSIASEFATGTGYSVNQAMLAIQRQNPQAFINGNINALKRGAILRMPTLEAVGGLSKRAAMLEAIRQEQEYLARRAGRLAQRPAPAVAETPAARGGEPAVPGATDSAADAEADLVGHLELVPPGGPDAVASAGQGDVDADDSGRGRGPSANEALARTEEELANAQQENEYLSARIRELEEELTAGEGTVTDTGLAELEDRLREDRSSGAPQEPMAVTPPRQEPAWYRGKAWWAAGLLVVLVAAAVLLLRRFRGPAGRGTDAVSSIKDEAEEVLKVLESGEPGESVPKVESANVIEMERYVEPGHARHTGQPDATAESTGQPSPMADEPQPPRAAGPDREAGGWPVFPGEEEEAVELDADDPETKLDLARAYLSMGDARSARRILEEVIAEGSLEQVAEARSMMKET